jgi:hypothetical protein
MTAAEREFLDASVAVWREIDARRDAEGHDVAIEKFEHGRELRLRERAAWERYRDEVLDAENGDSDE